MRPCGHCFARGRRDAAALRRGRRGIAALPADANCCSQARDAGFCAEACQGDGRRSINPSTLLKSRKSGPRRRNIREGAMRQDGAAMCEFYAGGSRPRWPRAHHRADDRRAALRRGAKRPGFVRLSFSTIAGFNANGAMPHYRATPESHAVIEGDGLLLIDSGGCTSAAPPTSRASGRSARSARHRSATTQLVLKGHDGAVAPGSRAALSRPCWTPLARAAVEQNLDYGHGTGHGVATSQRARGPAEHLKLVPTPPWRWSPA